MCKVITHRGPDEEGSYIWNNVGLGSRRLSIIDVQGGHQPMQNEDGQIHIVFNGEIYNYLELRELLQKLGHIFHSNSDTEVIVHAYEQFGEQFLRRLNGMFAIAIWDHRYQRLILARDRIGQKPLYFALFDGGVIFGSELNCLLQYPRMPRFLDINAIYHYLTLQYVPRNLTGLREIEKLEPGHVLISQRGYRDIHRHWNLFYLPKHPFFRTDELQEELREEMTAAVRRRLISDVPLGAHLSGGIDSSIIVALMAGMTDQPVKTFSIGFEEDDFSELPYARQIAKMYGTEHYEFVMEPDAIALLPRLVHHFGEPLADPAAIPTWYLAEMTRKYVTVALNGDGGDEFFGGYQRYWGDRLANAYALVPKPLRKAVDKLLYSLPVQSNKRVENNLVQALRQLSQAASLPKSASIIRWGTYFNEGMKEKLFLGGAHALRFRFGVQAPTHSLLTADYEFARDRPRAKGRLDLTLFVDAHNYLPGALLPKIDRMAMAHSLEPRSPFLDHRLMEFAACLPADQKVRLSKTKRILRETFKDLLPSNITERNKAGFSVPLGSWFKEPLYDYVRDRLLSPSAEVNALFKRERMESLIEDNRWGRADNGKRLWALLVLEEWLCQYT